VADNRILLTNPTRLVAWTPLAGAGNLIVLVESDQVKTNLLFVKAN
jgi:hypothetical protein